MDTAGESSRILFIIALNVALGALVLVPLLLVLKSVLASVFRRLRRRSRESWEEVPGVGWIPVLREPAR